MNIEEIAKGAKRASIILSALDNEAKNKALAAIIEAVDKNRNLIFEANKKDLIEAENKVNPSVFNRLKLDENKMRDILQGAKDIIKLTDPVNQTLWTKELDDNLILKKVTCPIGVIGVIFEARPDVMMQITSLAIKSANCVILKGGSETTNTNKAFFEVITNALNEIEGFPKNVVNLVFTHDEIKDMLEMSDFIDLIIPRGSNKLVKYIKENTKIPVLGHASGICHIFVDKDADFENTKNIVIDSKTQYPSACNAVETILIHKDYKFTDKLKSALAEAGVEIIENPASFSTEYGEKKLALKIVNNINEAIEHVNTFGSGHTDCIITKNNENAQKFCDFIDSAGVFVNVSTRFSDGFRYGFGAEVGISTNKTHARGPVGLDGLTIYKYKLVGNNQIVGDYVNGKKTFKHRFV